MKLPPESSYVLMRVFSHGDGLYTGASDYPTYAETGTVYTLDGYTLKYNILGIIPNRTPRLYEAQVFTLDEACRVCQIINQKTFDKHHIIDFTVLSYNDAERYSTRGYVSR